MMDVFDVGGAAAILGAARAVARLEPEAVEVHFVAAACEVRDLCCIYCQNHISISENFTGPSNIQQNKVNERSIVPGDIVTALNGKTIEILNTDSEGRLCQADALVFVDQKLGCDEILEMSTLTGSCVAALGQRVAGLWCKSDQLAYSLLSASEATGEKVWRMPLEQDYKYELQSKYADMNNLGSKHVGAISAALFLQEFVDESKPYAHIDMAGPVWTNTEGATGWGVKLVTEWICGVAARHKLSESADKGYADLAVTKVAKRANWFRR